MKLSKFHVGAALVCSLLGATGCATSDNDDGEIDPTDEAAALKAISCGPTASDTTIATELHSVWGGNLNAARIACGRRVVAQVKARGLTQRAAEIAVETVLVEAGMLDLNGGDRDSVGLFQQRNSWGTVAQRENPEHATDSFLDVMLQFFPKNAWQTTARGKVAQGVQRSAFPDRYEKQTASAIAIVAKLWPSGPVGWDQVIRADLDGNGDDELGLFSNTGGTFAWYPMTTDGQLGTRLSSTTIGSNWTSVFGFDPDGDGADSLAFYDAKDGNFAVYTASVAGLLGTRKSQSTLSAGWTSIVATDFDGDGRDELAFYNATSGAFAVYATNADSTLGAQLTTLTLGTGWTSLIAFDVTGDGLPELGFYNATTGGYAVYSTTTAGALAPRLSAATLSKGWTAVEPVQAVGSGRTQLAFYNRSSNGFAIYAVDATGQLGTELSSFPIN